MTTEDLQDAAYTVWKETRVKDADGLDVCECFGTNAYQDALRIARALNLLDRLDELLEYARNATLDEDNFPFADLEER